MNKIIAYLRVSTAKQGNSGLGLEGQRKAIEDYAASNGAEIVAEYLEVESGKKTDSKRQKLAEALDHTRNTRATLVVAKLDRLARSVAFLSALMESKVEFVCCDNPHATRLTIHILAAVAEDEAAAISARTKAALAAYKARGGKLGSARPGHWHGREHLRGHAAASAAAAEKHRENARIRNKPVEKIVQELRHKTLQAIADEINRKGFVTTHGNPWSAQAVHKLRKRLLA